MHVRSVELTNYMTHASTRVTLPEHGLVLVTGPNGSGKSALIEAVATAAWGKTLRGSSPWSGKGSVEILTDEVTAKRTRIGRGKNLVWRMTDEDNVEFESNTKSQEALERVIGSFEVWRRTSVFSSQDAAHFTLATDAERKRLIEALLGLERFDPALAACRSVRKNAEAQLRSDEALLQQLESQLSSNQERVGDATRVLATVPEPLDVTEARGRVAKLASMVSSAKADRSRAQKALRDADRSEADLMAEARNIRRRLEELGEGNCDNCGQPIPQALRADLSASAEQAEEKAVEARKTRQEAAEALQADVDELSEEIEDLSGRLVVLEREISDADGAARQRKAAEESVGAAEAAVGKLEGRIDDGRTQIEAGEQRLALQRAAEVVLGLKGVRAHVLGRALAGLEAAANGWLSRVCGTPAVEWTGDAGGSEAALGGGMCIRLKPYTEKKAGGVSDSISISVEGAAGGEGYRGASGGQRRRLDVALLFALSDMAQAAHGRSSGTLFIDEALDGLDADGVHGMLAVLSDMAKERAVVVISHNPELQGALQPDMWLSVGGGKVERVQ